MVRADVNHLHELLKDDPPRLEVVESFVKTSESFLRMATYGSAFPEGSREREMVFKQLRRHWTVLERLTELSLAEEKRMSDFPKRQAEAKAQSEAVVIALTILNGLSLVIADRVFPARYHQAT